MRRWPANLTMLGASLVVALGLAEAALRLAGISHAFPWTFDRELGLALRAGSEGIFREEGVARFRINSQGLRDREHAIAKPPGVLRIAVLGDSFAEALQLAAENAFWSVLERELAACPGLDGRRVETLNFGVSGYSTAQSLIVLRRKVWRYRPDIVLLAFYVGNDVEDNSRALSGYARRPYFRLREGRLELDDSFRRDPWFRLLRPIWSTVVDPLIDRSRVVQLLNEARRQGLPNLGFAREASPAADAPSQPASVFAAPATAAWQEAWRVTEALLLAMRDEAGAHGARFWPVTLSVGWQVHPDPAVRRRRMQALGVEAAFYPETRLTAFAARHDMNILTLAQPMQRHAETEGVFLHGFSATSPGEGHWNAHGHRRAGELMAERLCRDIIGG